MMKKDPKSIPVRKGAKDRNVNPRKCSFLVKVACLNLMIIAAGVSVILVADLIYHGTYGFHGKKDGAKVSFALGIALLQLFPFAVPLIWANLIFIAKRKIKSDANAALKIIRFCQISSLILIVIGLVGGLVAFPDMNLIIWAYFPVFDAILFAAIFYGMRLERASKFKTEIEKETSEEEAPKSELAGTLFVVLIDTI